MVQFILPFSLMHKALQVHIDQSHLFYFLIKTLTLLHSERPKSYGVFGLSECNRVKSQRQK